MTTGEERMTNEEQIQQDLIKQFSFLNDKIRIQRERRIYADVPEDKFFELVDFICAKLGFNQLCTITGLDDGNDFGFIYHFSEPNGILLNVKYLVPKSSPTIKTIIKTFPSAHIYERELEDMFGVKVEGLPKGNRYPLPDNWPTGQYPLRKDWNIDQLKQADQATQQCSWSPKPPEGNTSKEGK